MNEVRRAVRRALEMPAFPELKEIAQKDGLELPERANNMDIVKARLLQLAAGDQEAAKLAQRCGFLEGGE